MDEAEKFWSDFEIETGEKVVARSMGIWHENGEEKGRWGLLILTDKSFRYRYMPSDNLFLGLFRTQGRSNANREQIDIMIPLDHVATVAAPTRSWFQRLFGSPFDKIVITWDSGTDSEPRHEEFSADPSAGVLAALRAALPKTIS